MDQLQEKRKYARRNSDGPIVLLHTHRESEPIDAGLLNFSQEGLSFFSHQALTPGTTIMVRATGENYPNTAAAMDCQLPTMRFATIKWRRDDIHRGRSIHRMGAVYVMPR